MTKPQVEGAAGVKNDERFSCCKIALASLSSGDINDQESIPRPEELALHTINEHLHIVQHFCRRHFCLFLSQFVQPLQIILDVVPA